MNKCGERIAFHRRRLNMTQTELGEQLNVTAQAISKWENGASEPDLTTVQKLCKIFGISVDELLNWEGDAPSPAEEAAVAVVPAPEAPVAVAAPAPAPVAAPAPEPKVIVGYCDKCKKPIEQRDDYEVVHHARSSRQELYCRSCYIQKQADARKSEYYSEARRFRNGWIVAPIVGGAIVIASIIAALVTGDVTLYAGIALGVAAFTFAVQCFWTEFISDMFFFFLRSFRMPGLIFTLSLDGIIWLITVKLFLAILSGILSVLCFLFGTLFTLVVSVFSFPFCLPMEIHKLRKLHKAAFGVKAK